MAIFIHQGDIFQVKATALVIPANRQPELNWGSHIAEKVKTLISQEVKEERQNFGVLELGESCLTRGDGTEFQYLIHSAVLDKYDFNPLFLLRLKQRTSDLTLQRSLISIQEIIDANEIDSLAISAMGAGIGAMNYERCVLMIFEAFRASKVKLIFAAYKAKHAAIARRVLKGLEGLG